MDTLMTDPRPVLSWHLIPEELPDVPRYSASQTKTAMACLAKHWFDRRTPRSPETPAQMLGLETHKRLETMIQGDPLLPDDQPMDERCTDLEPSKIARADVMARAIRPHFPQGPNVRAEWEFRFVVCVDGVPVLQMLGYIDCSVHDDKHPSCQDLKTTSNFKYALTPETLRSDPQAMIYAAAMLALFPDAVDCTLQWIYAHSRNKGKIAGPKPQITVSRAFVELSFRALLDSVWAPMIAAGKKKRAPLGSAPDACTQYGGCPFDEAREGPCKQNTQVDHLTILLRSAKSA